VSRQPRQHVLRSPEELQAFMARFLVHDPSHERWLGLWTGTLRLLADQEPRAYRSLLARLERHGLGGVAPQFWRTPAPELSGAVSRGGVAVFVKQLGTVWARRHGGDPKGADWSRWPPDLHVHAFPTSPA
jgi:hypothetical protein